MDGWMGALLKTALIEVGVWELGAAPGKFPVVSVRPPVAEASNRRNQPSWVSRWRKACQTHPQRCPKLRGLRSPKAKGRGQEERGYHSILKGPGGGVPDCPAPPHVPRPVLSRKQLGGWRGAGGGRERKEQTWRGSSGKECPRRDAHGARGWGWGTRRPTEGAGAFWESGSDLEIL